jgi:hypothetical protein
MKTSLSCATLGLCALWVATSIAACSSTVEGGAADGAVDVTPDVVVDVTPDVTPDAPPPLDVVTPDAGPVRCASNGDCPSGTLCQYALGCDQTRGTCLSDGCQSLPVAPQYCGCDGRTLQETSACLPGRPYASNGPCVDAGAPADVSPTRYRDAVMLWQSPGGFAGWGPAVMVTGDGVVRMWRMRTGFTIETASSVAPDRTERVSPVDIDALFGAWAATPVAGLPHAGTSVECYPSVTVRACARCDATTIMYTTPASLQPEMNAVWAWFEARYGVDGPQNYCRF